MISAHWTVYLAADVECKGDETAKGHETIYIMLRKDINT